MFRICLLLSASIFVLTSAKDISKTKFPSNIRELKSLHELIKLVNDHDMNLSIILSEASKDDNGSVKTVKAVTFTFPESSVAITKSNLKSDILTPLLEAAKEEELGFEFTKAEVDWETNWETIYHKGISTSASHRSLISGHNGKNGFFSSQPHAAQYNFQAVDGKTTRVVYGDLDIALGNHSNFKEEEVNILKKTLAEAYFTYADELVPAVVSKKLDQILPSYNWEVVNHLNEIGYLESGNWAQFKVLNDNYLIYTI